MVCGWFGVFQRTGPLFGDSMHRRIVWAKWIDIKLSDILVSPGLATQLWADGCVALGVCIFQDIAMVWS